MEKKERKDNLVGEKQEVTSSRSGYGRTRGLFRIGFTAETSREADLVLLLCCCCLKESFGIGVMTS